MITRRPSAERGHADHGWLDTYYTFSFADYYDPRYTGFRDLLVINEDRVQPGRGFPRHSHRDMEILTYVVEGAVEHRDSMGNHGVIAAGDVQRMSAGTGVTHSEVNPSPTDPLHLLQIWILPARVGLPPGYEQRAFPDAEKRGRLRLIAGRDGQDGALTIHQDARVYAGLLKADQPLKHRLGPDRHAWLQVIRGALNLNGTRLEAGDGAAVSGEPALEIVPVEESHVLLFDLA
jgi:hypothetical protein